MRRDFKVVSEIDRMPKTRPDFVDGLDASFLVDKNTKR